MSNSDSYSAVERVFLLPFRRVVLSLASPVVSLLAWLHVTPNVVSCSQAPVAVAVVWLMPSHPRVAWLLFVIAVVLDGLDGALARATGRASPFGALLDQYCDHIREVIVVAGLAWHGALNPLLAGLYGVTYPGFNLTLYLCNKYRTPVPMAIKSYLVVYPAVFLFLWFGLDWLDVAVALSLASMGIVILGGLWKLSRAMPATLQ